MLLERTPTIPLFVRQREKSLRVRSIHYFPTCGAAPTYCFTEAAYPVRGLRGFPPDEDDQRDSDDIQRALPRDCTENERGRNRRPGYLRHSGDGLIHLLTLAPLKRSAARVELGALRPSSCLSFS